MSEELRWNLSVQAVSGPTVAASGTIKVDAYNKTQVVVPANSPGGSGGSVTVNVDTTGTELLVVKATQYVDNADSTKVLQYDINASGSAKKLTAPLMFIGSDAVKQLADPVTSIVFTNPIETEITVDIIVGGDVTPTP